MNLAIRNELDYLYYGAQFCNEAPTQHDGVKQILPYFASLSANKDWEVQLFELVAEIEIEFPELIAFGARRARKAYETTRGNITKPSYTGRLIGTDTVSINQVEQMSRIYQKEPFSAGLVFSIFLPDDLIRRHRPGYVPCLVSGSVVREGSELHMNAFFRSQSIVEFGIFDLLYLRRMQTEIINRFLQARPHDTLTLGNLNIFCARVFVHRRLLKKNTSFIRRDDILPHWTSLVERFRMKVFSQ